MNPSLTLPRAVPLMVLGAMLLNAPALADEAVHSSHVITIGLDGSENVEVDVSEMELGESRRFVIESGKTIDILKGPDGIELYIDGELFESGFSEAAHDHIALHEALIDIDCDGTAGEDCSSLATVIAEVHEQALAHAEGSGIFVARHQVEAVCDQEEDCNVSVWIDGDGTADIDFDADVLHDVDHEVIVIRKEIHADSQ